MHRSAYCFELLGIAWKLSEKPMKQSLSESVADPGLSILLSIGRTLF